jgi:hypothetical protein
MRLLCSLGMPGASRYNLGLAMSAFGWCNAGHKVGVCRAMVFGGLAIASARVGDAHLFAFCCQFVGLVCERLGRAS